MATILCVEDEADLRAALAEELREAGHEVIEAPDGAGALEQAVQRKPDLILSDITMPGMDGFHLVDEIRINHPRLAEVPVIFLSALAERDSIIEGVNLGADDYLTKPVDFELLLAKVDAKLRMAGRMIAKKQAEHVKLYKALNRGRGIGLKPRAPANPRRIVLVGRGDAELREMHALLDLMGHNTHAFTSGSAYLCWCGEGKVRAELTFIWFHTDDMQGPMIRKMAANKAGAYVLVVPEKLGAAGIPDSHSGFARTLVPPVDYGELEELVETTCDEHARKQAEHDRKRRQAG